MKAIIIEDEASALQDLQRTLSMCLSEIEIIGTANNLDDGKTMVTQTEAELLFMDIEVNDRLSFELLSQLPDEDLPYIIFTTGHEKYAIDAIKFSAIDYLLKPVDPEDLIEAVARIKQLKNKKEHRILLDTLSYNLKYGNSPRKIALRTLERVHIVEIDEIIRCEAKGNYTHFFLSGKREILISKTMREYESSLIKYGFYRVHRSHLINLKHVIEYEKTDGGKVILEENEEAPISYRKKEEFFKIMDSWID